jgi:hypothetical protein
MFEMNLNDCHGNTMYVIKAIGNMYYLQYPNGTMIAYITISSSSVIFKLDKTIIASGEIANNSPHLRFTYNVYTTQIDLAPIIAVTAKLTFLQFLQYTNAKYDKTDMCNQFFISSSIIALILLGILYILGIMYLCYKYNKYVTQRLESCCNCV